MLISKISQIVKTSLLITFLGLTASLAKAQIPEKPEDISPLLIGESIPDVTLWDAENQAISLAAILKAKPTVLVFYRGGWCPFCNVQLSSLARSQEEILKLGVACGSATACSEFLADKSEIQKFYEIRL